MKLPKDTYSVGAYEDLHFAVSQYGSGMHRQLWDLMVEAGFNRKQIFSKYMKVLRDTTFVNNKIIRCVAGCKRK